MSKFLQIDEYVEKIKRSFYTDKESDDFVIYLAKYHEKREMAKKTRLSENEVLKVFERNHMVFYNRTSQLYYNYIGGDYVSMNEDNLLYLALEFISMNVLFIDVNHKNVLKNKIIKQIKDNNIYETIPDSDTIQQTLSLLNETFFSNKAFSKCFLITIGRIILQKRVDNDFLIFTRLNMKGFLTELNKNISIYFCNSNLFNFFKFKFTHDHPQTTAQKYVIPCTKINSNNLKINEQSYVNMIVVAIYYFNRYHSIDNYLKSENILVQIKENIHYLNIDKDKIIQQFAQEHIIQEKRQSIQQKELIFLWKKFKYEKDIFVTSFTSYNEFVYSLFTYLNVNYNQDNHNNILDGYYSFDLPYVDDFKSFWNDNFSYCEEETNFELNEILFLYNKYGKIKKNNLNEVLIKLILQCFYPKCDVIGTKIINGVKSSLWDKKEEILSFISKNDINIEDNMNAIYKQYVSTTKNEYRISKLYFSNFINHLLSDQLE